MTAHVTITTAERLVKARVAFDLADQERKDKIRSLNAEIDRLIGPRGLAFATPELSPDRVALVMRLAGQLEEAARRGEQA